MFIQSSTGYKSIGRIQPPIELPDFVVLSGLNGAGKSQLLEALNEGAILLLDQSSKPFSAEHSRRSPNLIKFLTHGSFAPKDGVIASHEMLRQPMSQLIQIYENYKQRKNLEPKHTVATQMPDDKLKLLKQIAEYSEKDIEDLNADDIVRHYPLEDDSQQRDLFSHSFSSLFKRYEMKRHDNEFDHFLSTKQSELRYLSEAEFANRYGHPPWILVNSILAEAKLDYRANTPEGQHSDTPFQLKLVSTLNGVEINFSDLSEGEKVIMSLALSLYNSKFDIDFPKVLLMDEPDSHLHPSMTKQFLDVIQNVFVRDKAVKVIMTTHSPSTVALAPEESLFVMNRTEPRIVKASKDKALSILTSGVPTLSIDYENRRQVFVESKYDVAFYECVYEKLKTKLVPEISISFISSGVAGSGDCGQVKEIVNKLVGFGNRSIYGIIDWDATNNGNKHVKVLGKDRRYSLENYIFDPILLAAFLLREKYVDRTTLGLTGADRYTDFSHFDNSKLQSIADSIISRIRAEITQPCDDSPIEAEYIGSKKINLPLWFCILQGHQLELAVRRAFPPVNKHRGEDLKLEIVRKVVDDIPDLLSIDLLLLMRDIQNFPR
jgi:ABC-type cobalamin/Fe3+-siderophores transport system ATPase subunit